MASYIYMQKLNEISQVNFTILHGKIKQEEDARKWALCQLTECF